MIFYVPMFYQKSCFLLSFFVKVFAVDTNESLDDLSNGLSVCAGIDIAP